MCGILTVKEQQASCNIVAEAAVDGCTEGFVFSGLFYSQTIVVGAATSTGAERGGWAPLRPRGGAAGPAPGMLGSWRRPELCSP